MAFVVTYHSLAKNNIRNLYGGLPEQIKLRTMMTPNALTAAQRIQEQCRRSGPTERFLNQRYYEYDFEHSIRVPRAPAFRQLSASDVDRLVERLSKPTVSKRRRASDLCEREVKRSFVEGCRKCRAASAQSVTSRQRVDEITSRVSKPTVTANVRNSLRIDRSRSAQSVRGMCTKSTPSDRFVQDFREYDVQYI